MPPSKPVRHLTFVIVPDTVGRSYTLRIPTWLLKSCLLAIGSAAVVLFSFSQGYVHMTHRVATLRDLQTINAGQATDIELARKQIATLQTDLEQLAQLDRTLRSEVDVPPPPPSSQSDADRDAAPSGGDSAATAETTVAMASSLRPDLLPKGELATVVPPAILNGISQETTSESTVTPDEDTADGLIAKTTALLEEASARMTSLQQIQSTVVARIDESAHYPDRWPVQGRISSHFGERRSPFGQGREFHPGLDIAAPYGTPIHAAADGIVTVAGRLPGFGNAVKISHGNGLVTLYGHQSRVKATVGEHVKKGQVIGYVGSSGVSTGPHLHFGVYRNGVVVDPLPYLSSDRFGYLSGN